MTNLCSVVIWQAPAKPNGIILGYEIEIGSQTLSQAAANFFFITMDAHQEANVVSRVRVSFIMGVYTFGSSQSDAAKHSIFR